MLRGSSVGVCALTLSGSCLAFAPAACSGADSSPDAKTAGAAGASAGTRNGNAGSAASAGKSASAGGPSGGSGAESGFGGAPLGGDGGSGGAPSDGGGRSPDLGSSGATGACEALVTSHTPSAGIHVAACAAIDYATNPPSSGQHYGTWADFGVYDFALPRGYWVHNLEHGAVVVTYNCAAGCSADIAAAKAWLAKLLPDAACPGGEPRVLLVPDPKLDVAWAASSWGFTLRADCFDAEAFSDFYVKHAGQPIAPEAVLCGTGFDFRTPGAETCGAN